MDLNIPKPTLAKPEHGIDSYDQELGDPGSYPYTRGPYKGMHSKHLWTMRQYAGFATAEESNKRYRYLLEKGTTGLSVAFDLPTQMGLDSDDPKSEGEVGRVGVAIDSIDDMKILFKEIDQTQVSTSMTINSTAPILLAFYVAVAKEAGKDILKLRGTIQNDLLKEYIARGTYIFPPKQSMRLITNTLHWCSQNLPQWNPISISGYHIREAGSTALQEIAFTLADGVAYVEAAIKAGLAVDDFAPRLSFFFNVHNDFFEEVAKFRAARRVWANIMKERFKAKNEKSLKLRFHAQTAGSTLTAQQPQNNLIRVTMQALSAVLGGTQSLHTNSYDEALQLPSQQTARLALRTQQIIAHETGVVESPDPLAGSYVVEALTKKLAEGAEDLIAQIDAKGGMVAAIETGWVQKQVMEASYQAQKKIESGSAVVVGVNRFQEQNDSNKILRQKLDSELEKKQSKRLKEMRSNRDQAAWKKTLVDLQQAAAGDQNLFPLILKAVECRATVGEISHTLVQVFGRHQEVSVF